MNQKRQKASVLKSTVAVLAALLPLGLVHAQASSASTVVPTSAATATKPTPAPVVRQKITYSTTLMFDFDQAALKPAGREALDEMVTKLTDMDLEAAVATGYTDRIGSDKYDNRLSLRRAQAVKAREGVSGQQEHPTREALHERHGQERPGYGGLPPAEQQASHRMSRTGSSCGSRRCRYQANPIKINTEGERQSDL